MQPDSPICVRDFVAICSNSVVRFSLTNQFLGVIHKLLHLNTFFVIGNMFIRYNIKHERNEVSLKTLC